MRPPPLPTGYAMPPALPAAGGWRRHWTWAVPLLALVGFTLACGVLYALLSLLFAAMRDNDAYRIAMAQMAADPQVVAAIGEPIEPSWFMSGHLTTGSRTRASLQIPVSAPRGDATVFVEAESVAGVWRFEILSATVDGVDAPIDLLPSLPQHRRLHGERIDTADSTDAVAAGPDDGEAAP